MSIFKRNASQNENYPEQADEGHEENFDDVIEDDADFNDDPSLAAPRRAGRGGGGPGQRKKALLLGVLLLMVLGFVGLMMAGGDDAPPARPVAALPQSAAPVPLPEMADLDGIDGLVEAENDISNGILLPDMPLPTETETAAMPPVVDMTVPVLPVEMDMPPSEVDLSVPVPATEDDMAAPVSLDAFPVAEDFSEHEPEQADAMSLSPSLPAEGNPEPEMDLAEDIMTPPEGLFPPDSPPPVAEQMPAVDDIAAAVSGALPPKSSVPVPVLTETAIDLPEPGDVPLTAEDIMRIWSSLPVEPATVRPLPEKFVTVRKESEADTLDARLASARRALNSGRVPAALQLFNALYQDYPHDTRVLIGRAVSLQRMGHEGEALRAYESVLMNDPKNLEALTNMLGLLKSQNPGLAVAKLSELRALYPYNADITTQLAVAQGQAGNLPEALRLIVLAEALKPDDLFILYNKAIVLDRMGRTEAAADLYRRLVRSAAEGTPGSDTLPVEAIRRRLAGLR